MDIGNRTERDDAHRVDVDMTPVVMRLDMLKIARLLERWYIPIQLAQPEMQVGIPIPDSADVTFEVTDVDWIEPDLQMHVMRMKVVES